MSKPWMPLYVADYLRDTRRLTVAQHGAYLLLIMEYWTAGGLPDDDKQLARIACMTLSEWRRTRPVVQAFFCDGWKHKRVDEELAHAEEVSSKRRASAKQRHSNSSANADANAEQMDTHARATSPSQSQSSEEANASSSGRRTPSARATRLPEDWLPSEDDGQYALGKGLTKAEAQHEFEKFRNYWQAKSGQGATKTDWSKTWRNWILTTIERKGKPNGNGGNRGRQSLGDLAHDLAEEARQREFAAGFGRPPAAVGGS